MHVLTIDLGTSGPKAAVVSHSGVVVGAARASVRTAFSDDGGAEQDPEAVWAATLDAASRALAAAGVDPGSFVAVVASAQYSSVIPVRADGTPVGNMLVWMDQRGAPKRLRHLDGFPRFGDSPVALVRWLRVHGIPPIEAGMSLTHMRWLRFARPDVYRRADSFVEPVDYLTARFTGRVTANQCSAFMMLLTDNRTVGTTEWHPGLVAQSRIDPDKLPEMVPVGSEVGTLLPAVAERLGLPTTTPVLSGINDTQAGAVAAGAFSGSHAGLALGTTSVIITHVAGKKTDPFHSLFTLPSPIGDTHLVSAENGVAGVAVDYFLDDIVYADDAFHTPEPVADRYRAFNEAAAAAGRGCRGRAVPPVAARLHRPVGRRPDAGWVPQRRPRHDPGRPRPGRPRGCGPQPAVAATAGREVHQAGDLPLRLLRRWRAVRAVVADHGRCPRDADPPTGGARLRQQPRDRDVRLRTPRDDRS